MKSISIHRYCCCLAGLLFMSSCSREEPDVAPLIFTEEVLYLSGEVVRLSGRIVSADEVEVSDHGFQISTDENFNNIVTVSLGSTELPGPFIGTYEFLKPETSYFQRAFMVLEGELKVGEIIEISTLGPELTSFEPETRRPGRIVTIFGKNFTRDTEVWFGNVKAEIVDIKFESLIRVRVPDPDPDKYIVPVTTISNGRVRVADASFEYIIGRWTKIADFPGPSAIGRNIFFTHNELLHIGMIPTEDPNVQEFWSYNPEIDQWTSNEFEGNLAYESGVFEGGFLGGASDPSPIQALPVFDFWTMDDDNKFNFEGVLPFQTIRPVIYRQGNDLFLFGGWLGVDRKLLNTKVRKYDFITKNWMEYDDIPITITSYLPSFTHDGLMYFITEFDQGLNLFRYDPRIKLWEEIVPYPGPGISRVISAAKEDRAYIGLSSESRREMFEYNITSNIWKEKTEIPPPPLRIDIVLGWYEFQGEIYVMRSNRIGVKQPELYRFNPDTY